MTKARNPVSFQPRDKLQNVKLDIALSQPYALREPHPESWGALHSTDHARMQAREADRRTRALSSLSTPLNVFRLHLLASYTQPHITYCIIPP
jgi:hypothetical protein